MYREGASVSNLNRVESDRTFEQAVLPERRRLYGLALIITRDPSAAEDAVQETLFSAWRSWSKVRDPQHPGGWLTRICVRQCLRRRQFDAPSRFADPSVSARAQGETAFGGELLDFDRAFGLLTAKQRAVFTLQVRHGYTVAESAGLMGCRPGTARSHLGRAVARLRKEMSHE
jgi:RNA polymerase sigma-70 factor (ECF subfamily)